MPRLDPPDVATMSAAQKRIHDLILSGPRGQVRGPLAVWLHRPAMAEHAQALGQYCRYDSSLSPRLSELAILTMGRWWGSDFEWWAHKKIALREGVAPEVIHALRDGTDIPFTHEDEAVMHRFLTTLLRTRRVSDDLYQLAVTTFGKDGVIDLVALAGYYTLISMTLNVFEIEPPEGEPRELAGLTPTA